MKYLVVVVFVVCTAFPAHAGLIERIMGEPGFAKIAVHTFFALNNERIHGRQTRQNVIDALKLSASDIVEYDALVGLAPVGVAALDEAKKGHFLNSVHSIFLLAEVRMPGYNTPAQVRSKLGLP